MLFVEGIVTSFDTFREELGQTPVRYRFTCLRGLWGENPESRDDIVESLLKRLTVHHAVVVV